MQKTNKKTPKGLILIIALVALIALGAVGIWAMLSGGEGKIEDVPTDDVYEYVNPGESKAQPDEGFTIDGVLDEKEYLKNKWLYLHNDDGGNNVDIAMTSYYGEKGMYFVYDVTETVPIYVNLERASYLNSCIEMYFAPSTVTTLNGNSVFEVDLLPTGDMVFKQANGKGGYVNVATTDDKMAYLGATTKGGEVNSESCYGYCLELFIPWDYMQWLGMDVKTMKDSFVYVDPAHITSNNFGGTDASVDRYWYYYAQQHGASFGNVYQYYRFDANGAQGTVATNLTKGENYTITGDPYVIPGMLTTVTITPEQGYALNSVLVNGQEYIQKVSYNEDGSVTLNVRGEKDGLTVSATTEKAAEGNKTLRGSISLHNIGWDSLDGALISYKGPQGEKALEVDGSGKFQLTDLRQGYYTIKVEKTGYKTVNRGIYLNRDIDAEISLEFDTFYSESGSCWVLDDQNDGIIRKFGGQGFVLTNAAYDEFTFEANFKYEQSLNEEKTTTSHFTEQRMGMRIRFSNGKYWNINLLKQNGEYILQYAARSGSVFTKYKHIHTLNDEQIAKYTGKEGIALRVVRDGQYASVYLDGELLAVEDLGKEYSDCTAQLGFEAWVANREIMDIPFTITGKALTDVQSSYFYKANGWVITGQYDGKLYVEGSEKSTWLNFGKKYINMDLTLNAKDYIGNKTPLRLVAAMNFDNGKNATFSITYSDGEYKLQAMGDSIFGWRNFYKLTDEEIAKFQSKEGIDLRIVRIGTEVSLYLDGKEVCSGLDLTGKESGVTADMPATVAIRHYGNVGHTVEIPFAMTEEMNIGTITVVDSKNGGITVNKYHYMIGDTIYLSDAGEDGYYCTGMKVNGETVPMHWDGTYSFKTSEKEYTVEGTFDKAVFQNQPNWDLMDQNKGVITRHDGIGEGWLEMIGTHKDLDITMTLRGIDETSAAGVRFVFKNDTVDEWATFRIVCEKGVWKLKSMNDSVFWWADFHKLTAKQVEKYLSDDGLDFRVVRKGTDVYLYLDGERVCDTIDLTVDYNGEKTGINADMEAVVRIRHYGTTGEDLDIPFVITDKVEAVTLKSEKSENGTVGTQYRSYLLGDSITLVGDGKDHYYCTAMTLDGKAVALAYNGTHTFKADKKEYTVGGTFEEGTFVYDSESGWDVRKQNEGVVSLPNGGNGGWLEFYNKYTDVDITLNVQDYADGEKDPRTELLFAFDTDGDGVYTDAHVTYGVISESKNNKAFIQSIPVKNLGTGVYADKYPNHGNLTADEYADFINGGVALRVVRSGTDVHLYIGDRKVNVKDLTENETGIKADTKMVVYLRHYDDIGITVEIPFQVTDKVQTVKVTAESCENGTIVTQFPKYLKNDTIVFFGEGKDHYYCNAMTVNGDAVTQHWNGTYSVKAVEDTYTASGDFVPGIFVYNDGWDLLKQNEGKITVKYTNANGNSNWLDFYDKYTDMDVTLNVREYADDVKGALTRSAIRFTFDNGEIITFSIAKNSGNKYTVQALSGDTIVDKSYDFYVMDDEDIAALNSEDGIDFRIIKEGSEVDIYFGSVKVVEDFDLTTGDSGVTADMQAKVSIRRFDDPDIDAEYSFKVSDSVPADDKVTVSIDDTQNGTVTTKWNSYIVGESVILSVTPEDGYYCKSLTVTKDGVPVALNETLNIDGGEYTFTAQEGTYSVSAVFAKKVFVTNSGWDLLQQSTGLVAIPGGGNGGWLEFIDKYTDMDVTVTARNYEGGTGNPRTELLLVFDNGAHVSFGITCDSTHAWIQSLNQADNDGKQIYNRYKGHGELTAEEYAAFTDGGVDFRMVRKGTDIHLYIGDRKVNVLSLTNNDSGVTADTEMTVYIRHYDDSGVRVEIPFEVSSTAPDAVDVTVNATQNGEFNTHVSKYLKGDYVVVTPAAADSYACSGLSVNGNPVDKLAWDGTHTFQATEASYTISGSFAKKLFTDHDNWNTVNQHFGVITRPNGAGEGWLEFAEKKGDFDITMTLKGADNTSACGVRFAFIDDSVDEWVTFRIVNEGGIWKIKSMNDSVFNWATFHELSGSEVALYMGDGIDFRVVRYGTCVDLYLNGVRVKEGIDLTVDYLGNPTGITADMKAAVRIRHYGTTGENVEIPFELQDVQRVYVTVNTSVNGTVTTNKNSYRVGDTVTLTVTPAEGYYNKSVAVKNGNTDVTLGGTFNIDGGTYTFTAGNGNSTYTVSAEFAKKVFVSSVKFNLVDQDKSVISNKITSSTGYISTIEDYNQFTITLHDPDGDDADTIGDMGTFQLAGQFNFDLGNDTNKIVNIQVTRWEGTYYIKSANAGSIFGNNMEYCRIDANNAWYSKITGNGVKLTVARVGTDLVFYLSDGTVTERLNVKYKVNNTEYVSDCLDMTKDMSGNDTGITKNAPAKVEFCSWYSEIKEIPFKLVKEQPAYSTVTIADTENGKITSDKKVYLYNETVTLTVTPDENCYCIGLNVDGQKVSGITNNTYSFTATKTEHTVDGEFFKMLFNTDNAQWDVYSQHEGILKYQNLSNKNNAGVVKSFMIYNNVDFTITLKDINPSARNFRGNIHLDFGNNTWVSFSLTNDRGQVSDTTGDTYIVQHMDDSFFTMSNENAYTLAAEQVAKVQGDGLEFRVVRVGAIIDLYVDGIHVGEYDLTKLKNGNDSGVATKTTNVQARIYGANGQSGQITFKLKDSVDTVTVNVPETEHGTVTLDQKTYLPGETVTLTITPESGYYHNLKLNDEFIVLDWNDTDSPYTYSFTAEEGTNTYAVTGTFEKSHWGANTPANLNTLNQHGVLGIGYTNGNSGWIWNNVTGNTGKKVTELMLNVKNYLSTQSSGNSGSEFSVVAQLTFDNNKVATVRIINEKDSETGVCRYRLGKYGSDPWPGDYGAWLNITDETLNAKGVKNADGTTMTAAQFNALVETTGVEMKVTASGTTLKMWLLGYEMHSVDISSIIAESNYVKKVAVRHYGNWRNATDPVELPYSMKLEPIE